MSRRKADGTTRARGPRRIVLWVGLAALVMVCLLSVGGGLLLSASNRARSSLPRVHIADPRAGDELVAGRPAIVYGRAADPDGVAEAELWINGELVATQANAGHENPFKVAQSWRPLDPGAYLLLVRATDARGFVGQSPTVLVDVKAKTAPAADAVSEVPAGQGGGPPALIPIADDPQPAEGITDDTGLPDVRIATPLAPGADAIRGAAPSRPLIGVLCTVLPAACDEAASETTPRLDPELCMFLRGTRDCSGASRSGFLPPVPPRIGARYAGACSIEISWSDESDDETGFRLYRIAAGPEGDLVGLIDAGGTSYTDRPGAGGEYRYYVAAFNSEGESPSAPSELVSVPVGDCATATTGDSALLDLEALTFTVDERLDRIYCYYAIGGSPFVRIPGDEAEYLEPVEGGWDIAVHAAGDNRIAISQPRGEPLAVAGECLGWRGFELLDLGGFHQAHASEEWDGRPLANAGGQFRVTYRIQPATLERREGAPSAIVDPSLPAPYNLQYSTADWCEGGGTDPTTCAAEEEAMLHWQWELPPGDTRTPWGYEVYYRLPASFGRIGDATVTRRYFYTLDKRAPGVFTQPCIINTENPLEPLDVGAQRIPDTDFYGSPALDYSLNGFVFEDDVYYSVRALVASPDGSLVESPSSEEHWVGLTGCPKILVVQLADLQYGISPDEMDPFSTGEPVCEADRASGANDAADIYGWVDIAIDDAEGRIPGYRFWWNCPSCDDPERAAGSGPTGTRPPNDTDISCEPGSLDWSALALNIEGPDGSATGFRRANNTIVMPMSPDADFVNLRVRYAFNDYDSEFGAGDDLWCAADEIVQTQVGTAEGTGLHGFRVRTQRGEYLTDYDIGCSVGVWTYSLPVSP